MNSLEIEVGGKWNGKLLFRTKIPFNPHWVDYAVVFNFSQVIRTSKN